jgi:hypothetical protein
MATQPSLGTELRELYAAESARIAAEEAAQAEAKIKEALLHPEKLVRQEALLYFADCYSRDAEVMPLAIKAIETYGRRNAFLLVHVLAHLVNGLARRIPLAGPRARS